MEWFPKTLESVITNKTKIVDPAKYDILLASS